MRFNFVAVSVLLLGLVHAMPSDMVARNEDLSLDERDVVTLNERGAPLGQRCPVGQTAVSLGVAPTPNGCRTKAINVPEFSFHACCNAHDTCYSTCSKSKATCDTTFKTCMKASCTDKYKWYDPRRYACNDAASIYYTAVHLAGEPAFDSATKKHCKCV